LAEDWLTYWKPETGVVNCPLTIVASVNSPVSPIIADITYRDIFHDAPLKQISDTNTPYNSNNSYYASSSLSSALGGVKVGKFTTAQKKEIEG